MIKRLLFIIATVLVAVSPYVAADEVGYDTPPVVNAGTDVTALHYEELYAIFTLSMSRWENGQSVTVVMMPSNNVAHRFFVENYLGLGLAGYQRRLDNAIASGRADVPVRVKGNLEMIDKIKTTVGSIGYLDGSIYLNISEDAPIVVLEIK